MGRILIVEDDAKLGLQMQRALESDGFDVTWHKDLPDLSPGVVAAFALILLDLNLPSGSGMDFLRKVRSIADVPVLVVTGRNEVVDKVHALKLGADDYLTKPFWPEELLARVRARLRRPALLRDDVVERGGLRFDLARWQVFIDGREVKLTPTETKILAALVKRPDAAVTREALVEAALDCDRAEDTRSALDVHVSRLRKKLGGTFVETVWGIGYRLGGAPVKTSETL